MVAQKVEKQELARALGEKIPAWAQEYEGKLDAILRGSDAAFKQHTIPGNVCQELVWPGTIFLESSPSRDAPCLAKFSMSQDQDWSLCNKRL